MEKMHPVSVPGLGEVYFNRQPWLLGISENLQQHYTFDAEGRFLSAFLGGVNYHRGLDSTVMMKHPAPHTRKVSRRLSEDETRVLLNDIHARVARIKTYLAPSSHADLLPQIETILSWDYARLQQQQEAFQDIYKPVTILPPDQYMALVLQAAEGCSWNRCTFCTFYRDRAFRIKDAAAFREHIRQVKAFFGRSIGLRRSLFLGDANALVIPQPRLLELLQVAHAELPIATDDDPTPAAHAEAGYTLRGIYSFLDIFGAERKSTDDYRELRAHGLQRIYIGLETGDPELFALLNKQGTPRACVEAVAAIKAAGINVGIILLAGAGGRRFARQHVAHSVDVVGAMGLGQGDMVYISPLITSASNPYTELMQQHSITDLSAAELAEQARTLSTALRGSRADSPRVSLYHIEEFLY